MKCPFCKNIETRVVDSRLVEEGNAIRRRRECTSCKERFTSYERYFHIPLMVVKKDKRREPFDRRKIHDSLLKAFDKKSADTKNIEKLAQEIEKTVRDSSNSEVPAETVSNIVLKTLKNTDQIAYFRYLSANRKFADISCLLKEIQENESPVAEQK